MSKGSLRRLITMSMMPPRFEEALFPNSGFDKGAMPPWIMVGNNSTNIVNLVNADGLVVKSRNPNIATFSESSNNINHTRELIITGVSPGITWIDVFAPNSNSVITMLEVDVKDKARFDVGFQFVTDDLMDSTTRSTNIAVELQRLLNEIYEDQTNISFSRTRIVPVQAETSLLNIVSEQERGDRHKRPSEWDKLVCKGDPNATINIFFMSWEGTDERRPSSLGRYQEYPSKILAKNGDFICDDGMTDE